MNRTLLIGIDGFDPGLAEVMLERGELPGFLELQKRGGWGRLATTNPAMSPTAWSTIATGCNPGVHGLFDFISRDPGSCLPKLAVTRSNPRNYFGNRRSAFLPARRGEAFWTVASAHKIPTHVLKWPVSFPPEPVYGGMLSGLGVPDVRGTAGRYTYYSTSLTPGADPRRGDVMLLPSQRERIETVLIGPDGVTVPMVIRIESSLRAVVEVQNLTQTVELHEWSGWIPVAFQRFGFPAVRGIFRLHLESLEPEVRLYASAIHMDPRDPPFPISSPDSYARDLAVVLGAFHTLGLPEETNGLVDGMISEAAFLQHAEDLFDEREAMFEHAWHRFREGLFVFVFDTLDRIQHTMWSGLSGPAALDPQAVKRMAVVRHHYRKLDSVIGRLVKGLDEKDLLLVVSDHGFTTFDRSLHVNSWLREQGLLVLKDGLEGLPLFENINWRKTKAYALGFVSLYLNEKGREPEGVVTQDDGALLKQRLAAALRDWKDPLNGERVLHAVYDSRSLYQGPFVEQGPDMVLAPRAGYRVSWQTGYGAAPLECVVPNDRAWRADHIVDPSLVPGVLFSSRPLDFSSPRAADIAPTVLNAVGAQAGGPMEGRAL